MPATMQIGSLTAFLTYLIQILMSVMMATFLLMIAPRAAVCAERIQEVLDTDSSVVLPTHPVTDMAATSVVVEFRDTEFTYPGAESPVLRDITLHRRARPDDGDHRFDRCRQVDPDLARSRGCSTRPAGRSQVDGVEVRDCDPDLLWSRIGLVPQKPFLFSGTVASNLRYGNPDATDDELWQALRVAQAEDFVRDMPGPAGRADLPRRHQRLGRPAAATVHRPRAGQEARDLCLRRLVLGPGRGHRRPAAGGAEARDPGARR